MKVFALRGDGQLQPTEYARGPFGGIQGGAVAAMLCAQLEELILSHSLGLPVSVAASFLRATPFATLQPRSSLLRHGSRSATLMSELIVDSKCCAVLHMSTLKANSVPAVADLDHRATVNPSMLEQTLQQKNTAAQSASGPAGQPWLMDIFDVRIDPTNNVCWFGVDQDTAASISPLALTLLVADWAHGINRPIQTGYADPNINLNVHLLRLPRSRWIGVRSDACWGNGGIGIGRGDLYDEIGWFGIVSMSVAISQIPA